MAIDTADIPGHENPDDKPGATSGWMTEDELRFVRARVPMAYVEALPVRVDTEGRITEVGLLLRSTEDGMMTRALVAGRIRFGETVRAALFRHLENDLGAMAFPQLPPSPVPTQVAEYFPIPQANGFLDERQHAISLVFVVPVTGDCSPRHDALEVSWMSPEDAMQPDVLAEVLGGRGALVRQLLSAHGC